jgi:hypothetical protein
MALFQQRAAYDALAARLVALDLELLLGVPKAVQRLPGSFLVSAQITGPPRTFAFAGLRPVLTLVVANQDAEAAEYQLIDLVDLVANDLHGADLDSVCKCSVESMNYGWRDYGGIEYRIADIQLVLANV